ncbi:hypothetical protein K466DRAFT_603470 [Polyporus arcularius HHB13444]|uniref:Uncharacterized protein n=1 Tax=Polyporus arcularius HHB13444 TaxID=1314778 RepID=A0A5C3NZ17_9APHY|nr:hypothetical protein K466DRAFT_603470 [Polyporus arcularius HHB13444]
MSVHIPNTTAVIEQTVATATAEDTVPDEETPEDEGDVATVEVRVLHYVKAAARNVLKTVPPIIQDIVLALEVADGSLPIKVPGLGACLKLVVGIYEEYQRLSARRRAAIRLAHKCTETVYMYSVINTCIDADFDSEAEREMREGAGKRIEEALRKALDLIRYQGKHCAAMNLLKRRQLEADMTACRELLADAMSIFMPDIGVAALKRAVRTGDAVERTSDSIERTSDSVERTRESVERAGESVERAGDSIGRIEDSVGRIEDSMRHVVNFAEGSRRSVDSLERHFQEFERRVSLIATVGVLGLVIIWARRLA